MTSVRFAWIPLAIGACVQLNTTSSWRSESDGDGGSATRATVDANRQFDDILAADALSAPDAIDATSAGDVARDVVAADLGPRFDVTTPCTSNAIGPARTLDLLISAMRTKFVPYTT